MTFRNTTVPGTVPLQVEAGDYLSLARIYEPEVNLCVVPRHPSTGIVSFCDEFLRQATDMERRYALPVDTMVNTRFFADAECITGYPEWQADIQELSTVFADSTSTMYLRAWSVPTAVPGRNGFLRRK
jgi:hypothetical protein